jgi:D-sedoheptulose 7-phosphate isomerase
MKEEILETIVTYCQELIQIFEWLKSQGDRIEEAINYIIFALKNNGKLMLFGCGGSAADAQHIAAELIGRFKRERKPLPAIALTTNTSVLTALSNDYSFDIVFARQVEALASENDVVIGISTSGKSKSVIEGVKIGKRKGAYTIALSGNEGGELAKEADIAFVVPSKNTPLIQTMHLMIGHLICEVIDQHFSSENEEKKA